MRRLLLLTLSLLLAAPVSAHAQSDPARLTLDRIFVSRDFAGQGGGVGRWQDSAHTTTFRLNAAGGVELVRVAVATGDAETLVTPAQMTPAGANQQLRVEDYAFSADETALLLYANSKRVWRQNTRGDYWILERASGRLRQLGGPNAAPSSLMFATFSPDGRRIAYVRDHNLYVEDAQTGAITALTTDGSSTIINGTFDWVYEEEFGLQNGFRWSPDGAQIAYWRLDASGVRDFLMINDTDSLYSFTIPVQYPKAGETNSAAKIGVVSSAGGPTRWFHLSDDDRNHYPARMEWANSSTELVIQHLDRPQQRNELLLADTRTMTTRPILVETDTAWTDAIDDVVWFDDGRHVTWISDRDGWKRVYVIARDGSGLRAATPAGLDVLSVLQIDTDGGWIYYMSAPAEAATQRILQRTRIDGSRTERLTPASEPGTHRYDLSPGARFAVHSWSQFGDPPRTELIRLPSHETVRVLADNASLRAAVNALDRGRSFFTRLPADDGTLLDAYVMLPPGMDSTMRYPLLMHVYGEPASTTVNDAWGGNTYLWHLMLTQQGYIVMSVDPRGTPSPRGRAWRKSVYGRVGVQASADMAAAARAMEAAHSYVDPARVGIWGWSGGGSQTLNSMFRYPDVFAVGMAVAPVPDQRLYDTIYQERYSGNPNTDPENYRLGSPISFAEGLKGDLLIVHGTGDDNVHYQGTERLINRLIELNKPFTMMAYPNRSHGIYEGEGTTLHLYSLLTRYLKEHLLGRGRRA